MISVCLPTFNGEKFIVPQVKSILAELSPDDEIIVSDDASTDSTLNRLKDLDGRIKIFTNKTRLGPTANMERALQKANGDFIFFSDQDDLWLPGKVQATLSALRKADLVLHNAQVECDGKILSKTLFELRSISPGFLKNFWKNGYSGCCMAFSRKVLQRAMPFPKNLPMYDQWVGLVAERHFSVAHLQEPYIVYRIHGKNATHLLQNDSSLSQKISWRLSLLVPCLKLLLSNR